MQGGVVTSLAEVWIEISGKNVIIILPNASLPLRKCGLKYSNVTITNRITLSLPLRKCGLKSAKTFPTCFAFSHFPCGSVD